MLRVSGTTGVLYALAEDCSNGWTGVILQLSIDAVTSVHFAFDCVVEVGRDMRSHIPIVVRMRMHVMQTMMIALRLGMQLVWIS